MSVLKTLLVLGGGAGLLAVSCGAAQDKSEATYAAIVTACGFTVAFDRDAGAAGAADEMDQGCRKTLRVWQRRP